jgi:hypothetical protein
MVLNKDATSPALIQNKKNKKPIKSISQNKIIYEKERFKKVKQKINEADGRLPSTAFLFHFFFSDVFYEQRTSKKKKKKKQYFLFHLCLFYMRFFLLFFSFSALFFSLK